MIPTGEIQPVGGSVFDFRKPKVIGRDINQPDRQLKFAHGYDHNWVLHKNKKGAIELAVRVTDPLEWKSDGDLYRSTGYAVL
jgi:aldose 1-epimerase